MDVSANGEVVTIKFSPLAAHPKLDRPPETTTTFDEATCTFNLVFKGSTVSKDVIEKTGLSGSSAACHSLSLAQTSEGAQLSIGLIQPIEYRVDYTSRGGLSMTIWLRGK